MIAEVPHDASSFTHLIALAKRRIQETTTWPENSTSNLRELVMVPKT
jgi:hypothetical protein